MRFKVSPSLSARPFRTARPKGKKLCLMGLNTLRVVNRKSLVKIDLADDFGIFEEQSDTFFKKLKKCLRRKKKHKEPRISNSALLGSDRKSVV